MSSVALGLLLFSLPVLAMEAPQGEDKKTLVVGRSQGKIVFPPEMLFHIIKVVDPDFDRATAFYRDEAKTNNRKLNEVKQLLLNLRCTNHDWETSINQIFNEIPIGNKILRRGQSPTPHFTSIMRFYPNFLQPDEIQTQYKQLTLPESHFKNLVSFKVIYNARPSNKEEIRLLGDALESRANTLKYLNLRISLDEEDAKGFSERLAKLKKLEFLHINMDMVDPKGREHLIHSLADIPSLENIYLSNFSGDL